MAHSLSFNSIDLSVYGLVVSSFKRPMLHGADPIQLQDRAFAYKSRKLPLILPVDVAVTATDNSTLRGYLDSIRAALNEQEDKELIFDILSTRYWLARFESLDGEFTGPMLWQGDLVFACYDPMAYAVTPTTFGPVEVDADPDTIVITTSGTARISPVYNLISNDVLTDVTITLENDETGDTLSWVGSLAATDDLEIDVEYWTVKKTGVASMATVSGKFPQLLPNQANDMIITGFLSGTHNQFGVTYRNRYV